MDLLYYWAMLKNILAIETSSSVCSVALLHDKLLYEQFKPAQREQSQLLLPMVDQVLQEAAIKLSEISAITLAIGPGSFTGVRLGLSVVQGLCISTNIPVIPISSLQAMAQGLRQDFNYSKIIVCVNAYMGEVFSARYVADAAGIMQIEGCEQLSRPEEMTLPDELENWVGVGSGWTAYPDQLSSKPKIYSDYLPHAKNLITLAQVSNQELALKSVDEVSAVYLRTANAWRRKE